MKPIARWGFRPLALIAVSVGLLGLAALVVFPRERSVGRPQPLPVAPDEQEIAFLYPATSMTSWERLATAVQQARERLKRADPGVDWALDSSLRLTSEVTTTPPEVSLSWPGNRGRLVFRWYKVTSQWTPLDWIEALTARNPPPLAIVGGNSSYWARELADAMVAVTRDRPASRRPLLLLTTATADHVKSLAPREEATPAASVRGEDDRMVALTEIYPRRTYRFCFTNRQMATAITRFLWIRPELRPDNDPAYLVQWTDDSYSQDLFAGYMRVLPHRAADNFMQQWGWVTGHTGLGQSPLTLPGWFTSGFRHEGAVQLDVDSSVGSFGSPNPYEAKVVRDLLRQLHRGPVAGKGLLVITGQVQPSRRLLRDLARSSPEDSRRFVVAMGDAVSFNTIYRDRQVTWPIQDLPFRLVFFCHRNPIDVRAGFRVATGDGGPGQPRAAGTEDVLLYRDIVEALALAFQRSGRGCSTADELAAGLQAIRLIDDNLTLPADGTAGIALFSKDGQRSGGTGEHVVYLRPQLRGDRVLPRSVIEVWARHGDRSWGHVEPTLTVSYDEFEVRDVIPNPGN